MATATLTKKVTEQHRRVEVPAITNNPERMSGQSVIGIHRVSVAALLDYVDIKAFSNDYDTISEGESQAVIDLLKDMAEDGLLGETVAF